MSEHDTIGTYAVGALQPEDLEAFQAHLLDCPGCRHDVVGLREAASELSWLAAAPPPPAALRDAVLSSIPSVVQLPAAHGREAPPTGSYAPVVDLERERQARLARRSRVLTLLVAAVSVVALALGGVVVTISGRQQAPVASTSADTGLLSAPDARIVRATLPDGTDASFVVSRSQNRALFVAHDLPDPGQGRTYQLWAMRGGTATPDSTLGGGADVSQWLHGSVSEADHLAVTIEPAGGSTAPTGPMLASGAI